MNKLPPMKRAKLGRQGISTIEYLAVFSLICLSTCSAITVLSGSSRPLDVVSNRLAGVDGKETSGDKLQMADSTFRLANDLPVANMLHLQLFTAASSICIIAFGIMYIRQGRKSKEHQTENAQEVKFFKKQSLALRRVIDKRNHIHKLVRDGLSAIGAGEGKVETIMSKEIVSLHPSMEISEADEMLTTMGYRRVLVVDSENHLVGVLSRKDLTTKSGKIVADIMTADPKTATPDMDLRIALSMLLQNRISSLPVVKDNQLVGLVSTSDLLIVLQCLLVSIKEDYQNELREISMASLLRRESDRRVESHERRSGVLTRATDKANMFG